MHLKAGIALPAAFLTAFMGTAWSQSLQVTNVLNAGLLDKNFAPGSLVLIYGAFPSGAAGRNYSVTVGGTTGEVTVADGTAFITAEIPTNAPLGAQTLTVNYLGASSNAYPITIVPYAPEFDGSSVILSSSSSPPLFTPFQPFYHTSTGALVTPSSPAQPTELLTTYPSGLGQTNPPTTGAPPTTFTPLAVSPTLTVSNLPATIDRSGSGGPGDEVDFLVPSNAPSGMDPVVLSIGGVNSTPALLPVGSPLLSFFNGEGLLSGGVYYLQFANNTIFGAYSFVSPTIFYHYELGYEGFTLSNDAQGGVYLYDFASGHWFYTNPSLFPYLYDFTLNNWLYYFQNTSNPRYFSDLTTGKIFTM